MVKITPLKAILKKNLFRICLYEHFKEGSYKIPNFCISGINGLRHFPMFLSKHFTISIITLKKLKNN